MNIIFIIFLLEGEDFEVMNTTINFPLAGTAHRAPLMTNSSSINISIIDDQMSEGKECFSCTIASYSIPCKVQVDNPTKTICIKDSEDQGET